MQPKFLTCSFLVIPLTMLAAHALRGSQSAAVPSTFLQVELVAELNGMVDKYRKLVTTSLSQNYKELKVRKVSIVSADAQFMYVKLSVRVREVNGLTGFVLHTSDGSAKGKFSWGPSGADRLCVTTPLGQGSPLVITETKDVPKVGTPDEARAAEMAIKANFPREVCVPLWPTIRVSGAIAPEKTKGAYRHPSRPNKLVFTVSLSNQSARNVKVKYATLDGTAKAGLDYQSTSGELLIPEETRSRPIEVQLIPRDGNQGSRQVELKLWSPVNAKLTDGQAIGVILDTGQVVPSGPVPIPRL